MSLANNVKGLIISNSSIKRPSSLVSEYKNEVGGLSGKPIFLDSTIILKKMYSLTNGQIPLIGVGGISNGHECYEKIKAGASLVQLYTSLVFQGPKLIDNIIRELNGLILTDGYKNISEVIGKSS
jgi:Dihydroorotate dehydrogenase